MTVRGRMTPLCTATRGRIGAAKPVSKERSLRDTIDASDPPILTAILTYFFFFGFAACATAIALRIHSPSFRSSSSTSAGTW